MNSYEVESVNFGSLEPFGAFLSPRRCNEYFGQKTFESHLGMNIQLVAKFEKKINGRSVIREQSGKWTDRRTGLITIVPFRLKSGD